MYYICIPVYFSGEESWLVCCCFCVFSSWDLVFFFLAASFWGASWPQTFRSAISSCHQCCRCHAAEHFFWRICFRNEFNWISMGICGLWIFSNINIFQLSRRSQFPSYHSFRFMNNMDDTTPSTRRIFVWETILQKKMSAAWNIHNMLILENIHNPQIPIEIPLNSLPDFPQKNVLVSWNFLLLWKLRALFYDPSLTGTWDGPRLKGTLDQSTWLGLSQIHILVSTQSCNSIVCLEWLFPLVSVETCGSS